MKIFSLKENKLGMTLVEMVISLVILGILTTSTMGMVISSNNIFISTSKSAIDKQVGNYAFDFIEKCIRYTTHMSIYDSEADAAGKDNNKQSLSLVATDSDNKSGTLWYKRAEESSPYKLYDDSFYGGRTIQYSIHKVGNKSKHVRLKLTVFRDGRAVYSREAIVKCMNLSLVTIGTDRNLLIDKSSDDAVNQFITFSVDEKLISGGKDAFSVEYRVAEYMAKYNKIQSDYAADLNKAHNKYINHSFNAEVDPGVRNTGDDYTTRINAATFATKLDKVTNIVFGDGSNYSVYDKDNIDNCVNLRAEYQNRINNLLKFTLKESNGAQFTEGSIDSNNSIGGTNYKLHSGDEYYGVVATKEELYLGFMLTYYNKNGDDKITKDEYPQFESKAFFEGSSIGNYIKNTTDNQMVIMAYFNDNVSNDNYKGLVSTEKGDVYSYTGNYASPGGSVPFTLSNSITDPASGLFSTNQYPSSLDQNITYIYWSDQTYRMPNSYSSTSILDYLDSIGAQFIDLGLGTSSYNRNQNVNYTVSNPGGLTAGWYYVRAPYRAALGTRLAYSVFYLPAQENHTKAIDNGKNMTFTFNNNGLTGYARLTKVVFDQADYSMNPGGQEFKSQVTYKEFTAHNYGDYMLYGVDWNSWFKSTPQGILSNVINTVSNLITFIFGGTINGDITSISENNAMQSLGNIGQHNVNSNNSRVASYNLAWTVYSPKRGTWYYVPSRSTRLSGAASSIGWMSNKDHPTPLDADLENGTWSQGGSTALIRDIDTRKMTDSGFFGLVDTTQDVMWVALPTVNGLNPADYAD